MRTEQRNGSVENASTNEPKIGDAVMFLARKVTDHSLYMGIKRGVIAEFKGDRSRVRYSNKRSVWVDTERLRPVVTADAIRQIFLRSGL